MYNYFMCFKPSKNGHNFLLENLKKEFRRPRPMREENFKSSVGESACKKVDQIMCLTKGQVVGCKKSGEKASGAIKFRRFLKQLRSYQLLKKGFTPFELNVELKGYRYINQLLCCVLLDCYIQYPNIVLLHLFTY